MEYKSPSGESKKAWAGELPTSQQRIFACNVSLSLE